MTCNNNTNFNLQKKTGIILSILTFSTVALNFINGLLNFGETPFQAFINITVLPTLVGSFLLLFTGVKDSIVLRYSQVVLVLGAGFNTVVLTSPGNLTGVLFLLFGMALAYQYGYFASSFHIKTLSIFSIYMLATFFNVFVVNGSKLPAGMPSLLFSLAAVYLFWMVFSEEIKTYLVRTNQLSRKLDRTVSENTQLGLITADQARLIEEKNRALEENLREKAEIEKELRRTLSVKDVLLQEVHHRVKNNLAVIISLLNLQQSDDPAINGFIDRNSNRLHAMAAVHEAVYQNESSESVDLARYFTDIMQNLVRIYSENEDIKTDIDAENIEVTIDTAVPLGIILNDCVSNSIIYGFNGGIADKTISITVRKNTGIEMIIADNGLQFSQDENTPDRNISFSIWLVKVLAENQMNGSIETYYDNGNRWIIRFPCEEPEPAVF